MVGKMAQEVKMVRKQAHVVMANKVGMTSSQVCAVIQNDKYFVSCTCSASVSLDKHSLAENSDCSNVLVSLES